MLIAMRNVRVVIKYEKTEAICAGGCRRLDDPNRQKWRYPVVAAGVSTCLHGELIISKSDEGNLLGMGTECLVVDDLICRCRVDAYIITY
jgi:hypothetical protein